MFALHDANPGFQTPHSEVWSPENGQSRRRGWDSNPRGPTDPTVFKTVSLDHSDTPPSDRPFSFISTICDNLDVTTVKTLDDQVVELSSILDGKKTVACFLRHFG